MEFFEIDLSSCFSGPHYDYLTTGYECGQTLGGDYNFGGNAKSPRSGTCIKQSSGNAMLKGKGATSLKLQNNAMLRNSISR